METTQGISLHLKLAKTPCFSFYLNVCSSTNWRTRGQNNFCPELGVEGEVVQMVCTHINKCKNDKIKFKK
jgi:hypothetical protein